jgi:ATP-dependent DNA helicase pcrA
MIEDGIDPKSILLFTFTKKGANEIKERIVKRIGTRAKNITVGTYHSFCGRLLRKYVHVLKIWKSNFSIYDADDSLSVITKIIKEDDELSKNVKPETASSRISRWKDDLMSAQDAISAAKENHEKLCARIYDVYSRELRAQNAMDFDDLIFYAIKILEGYSDVKEQVNKRYRFLVADESQDSSPRDLRLIELLGGKDMNVCLIGDDAQCIFSFRGSNIQSFFDFVEKYKLKKFLLEQNYRSTRTIVSASKSVIKHNKDQFDKSVFTENDQGTPVVLYAMQDERSEAMRVTQIVKALEKRGVPLNEIAVLYRMSYLSRKIEDSFLANFIKYHMLSGLPFYARQEIKDLMAYLRFIMNPMDQVALERALTRPKRGIGEVSLVSIFTSVYEDDIIDIDQLSDISPEIKGKAKKGYENFVAVVQELNDMYKNGSTPLELIERLIGLTGYLDFLKKEHKEDFDDRKRNIEELMNIAESYLMLEDFVGNMTINETDSEEQDSNGVNMLTIHGSKGLEFKAVIIVGCNQGIIPHFKEVEAGDISEERRLFYVGMTRAKELLFLTRSKMAIRNGAPSFTSPSVFLNEIDKQYIKKT